MYFYSLKLQFKDGLESPLFGNQYYQPTIEYFLPNKVITKIDFHEGGWYSSSIGKRIEYSYALGGLTINFEDGTIQQLGPRMNYEYKSVYFSTDQYWVGLKADNSHEMYYEVQVLTLK